MVVFRAQAATPRSGLATRNLQRRRRSSLARGTAGRRDCSPFAERLRPTSVWPRLAEQRGGLLMRAGTVTPGIFACVTRPGRLVKDSRLGLVVSADPGVAPDFPRVCAWAARSLYPRFRM